MLQIQNIRKKFVTGDLTQVALDGVSLNLRENEFVAILGPSGSGKTTFLSEVQPRNAAIPMLCNLLGKLISVSFLQSRNAPNDKPFVPAAPPVTPPPLIVVTDSGNETEVRFSQL